MNKMYAELDEELLNNIKSGISKNMQLVLKSEAPIPNDTLGGRYRAVDRRLQVLRKAGKIVFDSKTGWSLTGER